MSDANHTNAEQSLEERQRKSELSRLQQSVALLSSGAYIESKLILTGLLQENAHAIEAHYLLGLTLIELHEYDEAVRSLERYLALYPRDPAAMFALATTFHKLKDYRSAINWYRAALVLDPSNFDVTSGLATALSSTGATHEAFELYDRLLKERPRDPITHINRGNTYQSAKEHIRAIEDYQTALARLPNDPQVRGYLANSLLEIGDRPAAIKQLATACRLNPQDTDLRLRLAQVLIETGHQEAGLAEIESIVDSGSNDINTLVSIGILYQKLERWDQALGAYDNALKVDPSYFAALLNRGTVNVALGREVDALRDYDECIHLHPNSADALFNRGNLQQKLRQMDAAEADFRNGLLIQPTHAGLNQNLAVLLFKQGRFSEAVVPFSHAVDIVDDKYDALLNLAQAHLKTGNIAASLKYNQAALSIRPEGDYLLGLVLHQKMMICDWAGWSASIDALTNALREGKPIAMPFHLLAITDDPDLQLRCSRNYADRRLGTSIGYAVSQDLPPRNLATDQSGRIKRPKIRLAYFSSDFYRHATTLLISEMIERHSKEQFEIIAYHFAPVSDDVTERIKSACDEFYDVSLYSSTEIIDLAKNNRIDIAVDLKGHTENSRTDIFAARIAPVQINYLGYPGTMGCAFIDYIVADEEIIPAVDERFYSERVIRIIPCYQPNASQRLIADQNFTRQELDLPDDAFVYCCFNNSYKITPLIFDAWMRILRAVPNSVLWLLSCNPTADNNLRREADMRGVEPRRLIFAPAISNPLHLSRLRNADLFIDTFPCGAHTTASDSLWSGVPLLALKGNTFASRVASSLLQAMCMTETIAHTLDEYEALAIYLGLNAEITNSLRRKLAINKVSSHLFRPDKYIDALERELKLLASV